jgi:glucuronokinase
VTTEQARAQPRAGLLGNPSDGFGGKVIAFTFRDFEAVVRLESAAVVRAVGADGSTLEAPHPTGLVTGLREARGAERCVERGGAELLVAALARFLDHCRGEGCGPAILPPESPALRFSIGFSSDIPRQVGFAGSSAIVTAALRALAKRFAVEIEPAQLAELALAAETEELGIAAGPQDRVVQAYGGLRYMDFRPPRSAAGYAPLDPAQLPPLFLAWSPAPGASSGRAHRRIRERFEAGDPELLEALALFAELAELGRRCLESGDFAALRELVDRNFDTRASIWPLSPEDREMVELGRRRGAAVKLAGSGGGVIGVLRDEADWPDLAASFRDSGYPVLRPEVGGEIDDQPGEPR